MHQKLELNNAIERLLDPKQEFDRDAVWQIIEFMKPAKFEGSTFRFKPERERNKFTGFTREQGNVTIEDDKTETREYSFGEKKERIGKYKLWKGKFKGYTFTIGITPFWASEITTRVDEEPSDEYFLFYDEKSERLSLGRVEYEKVSLYHFVCHQFVRHSLILSVLLITMSLVIALSPVVLRAILGGILGLFIGLSLRRILFNAKLDFNLSKKRILVIKGDDVGQKIEFGFFTSIRW